MTEHDDPGSDTAQEKSSGPEELSRRSFLQRGAVLGGAALLPPSLLTSQVRSPALVHRSALLRAGVNADVITFDPYNETFADYIFDLNIYDTMVGYDFKLHPHPRLAKSWAINRKGTSVTVHLRDGVKFQSGATMHAGDIVKNFAKAANASTGINMVSVVQGVKHVAAVNGKTLRIDFAAPTPRRKIIDILETLPIIDPSAFSNLSHQGVGAGPFKFLSWTPGASLTLERFGSFWGKPAPYVDQVIFHVYNDTDAMVAGLESGELDVIPDVPPDHARRLRSKFHIELGTPGALVYEIRINPRQAPFDNKKARQAFQYAVDRKGIVRNVLYGYSSPTVLPFGPISPAHDAAIVAHYPFDLSKTKSLLQQGKAAGGSAEVLLSSAYPQLTSMAEILQADLKKIGFQLNLSVVDPTVYVQKLLAGNFQMTFSFSGNLTKYPTWITLNSVYRTINNPVLGTAIPPSYLKAIQRADAALTSHAEKAAFANLRNVLLDESWVINIAYNQSVAAMKKTVKGFTRSVEDEVLLQNVKL